MKQLCSLACVLGLALLGPRAPAEGEAKKPATYPKCILLIRHAEKTGAKDDIHLSKKGKERKEADAAARQTRKQCIADAPK